MSAATRPWYLITLHVILLVLSVQVVALIRDNQSLRQSSLTDPTGQIAAGDVLQPASFVDLEGTPTALSFNESHGAKDKLLLVFSTTSRLATKTAPAG